MLAETHELKIWPENFQAVVHLKKTYEVRKADRDFKIGDMILLREWNPAREDYTGGVARVRIVYMTAAGTWGLPQDLCVFGINLL